MMPGTPFDLRPIVPPLGAESDRFASGTRSDLLFSFTDRNDVIRVQGWSNENNLGITLAETIAPPVTTRTVIADFTKQNEPGDPTRYLRDTDRNYVSGGAHANTEDVITGSAEADSMQGPGGNDALAGNDGANELPCVADLLNGLAQNEQQARLAA